MFKVYRRFVSPFLHAFSHALGGLGFGCRFEPTCGSYAEEAVREHGPIRGAGLSVRRVLRCNPWGGQGWDPVPRGSHARELRSS